MKILVDISRLPEAPYSKPKLPAARKPERPYETMVSQAHKKKRDWSKVRRGSRPNWFYTPEQDKVIKEMRAHGKTYAEIGKELGRSPSAIRHRAKKAYRLGGLMKVNIQLDHEAHMPIREHKDDAGADLLTPYRFILRANSRKVIDTGVHFEIPAGYVGMVKSKSGLMTNEGIVTDGTVDSGYSGSVRVCLFNNSGKHRIFEKGEKIAQIVFLPIITPEFEQVEEITGGERSDNGFGSTGRF